MDPAAAPSAQSRPPAAPSLNSTGAGAAAAPPAPAPGPEPDPAPGPEPCFFLFTDRHPPSPAYRIVLDRRTDRRRPLPGPPRGGRARHGPAPAGPPPPPRDPPDRG